MVLAAARVKTLFAELATESGDLAAAEVPCDGVVAAAGAASVDATELASDCGALATATDAAIEPAADEEAPAADELMTANGLLAAATDEVEDEMALDEAGVARV